MLGALVVLGAWRVDAVEASPAQATPTLRVGIKPLDPFVTRTGNRYTGFSIELWDEIARRNGWRTEYVWYETLPPLLDDVASGKVDATSPASRSRRSARRGSTSATRCSTRGCRC